MVEQYLWLRDWVLFSFFVDMPPMRPQNAVLEILEEEQLPGSRRANGILFYQNSIRLQLVSFKNSRYMGERVVVVPPALEKKLRAYMQFIRPVFGNFTFYFLFFILIYFYFYRERPSWQTSRGGRRRYGGE